MRDKLHVAARSFGRSAKDRRKTAYRADLYPKALIRPICGGCGTPMILGRSLGRYQSFCCFIALHGIEGCTNRGYKSARIIDEAVLGKVMATLFTDGFVADLTADVNARLAELARRPDVRRVREQDVVAALGRRPGAVGRGQRLLQERTRAMVPADQHLLAAVRKLAIQDDFAAVRLRSRLVPQPPKPVTK